MKKLNKDKLNVLLSSDKARVVLVIIGILAIFFIFISGQFKKEETKDKITELSSSSYSTALTEELTEMIESIEKAGESKVLLTLENSYEYVYLDDDKTLVKIIEPKVRGVAVACAGGDDPVVIEKITKMISTLLSVSTSSISVIKLI